jgi:hypothetical protein
VLVITKNTNLMPQSCLLLRSYRPSGVLFFILVFLPRKSNLEGPARLGAAPSLCQIGIGAAHAGFVGALSRRSFISRFKLRRINLKVAQTVLIEFV